jgi:hypothetical protein
MTTRGAGIQNPLLRRGYRRLPGLGFVAQRLYRLVARRRARRDWRERLLFGSLAVAPTYFLSRGLRVGRDGRPVLVALNASDWETERAGLETRGTAERV